MTTPLQDDPTRTTDAPVGGTPDEAPRRGRPLAAGVTLVLLGAAWLLAVAGVAVPWELVLPVAVVAVGLVLLVAGHRPEVAGLTVLGVLLAVAAVVAALLPVTSFSAGDRTHRPTEAADLAQSYDLGAGKLVLDLRELDLPPGRTSVAASVTMGELLVRLADDTAVEVRAGAGLGDVAVLGRTESGVRPRLQVDDGAQDGDAVLRLDLEVGLGRVEVAR